MSDIGAIIRETIGEFGRTASDINFGFCEKFAEAVAEKLGAEAKTLWFDDLAGNEQDPTDIGFDAQWLERCGYLLPAGLTVDDLNDDCPGHCFISYGGKYFDSECPEGVDSPFFLPYVLNRFRVVM